MQLLSKLLEYRIFNVMSANKNIKIVKTRFIKIKLHAFISIYFIYIYIVYIYLILFIYLLNIYMFRVDCPLRQWSV